MSQRPSKEIDWSVYAILDHEWLRGRDAARVAEQMIAGGASVIQYRNKVSDAGRMVDEATEIHKHTSDAGIPLILNDRVDVALAVGTEGVHVGQDDLPVEAVRDLAGDRLLIGASVHNLEEFEKVAQADHFGVGTVYQTQTKSIDTVAGVDIIRQIRERTDKPIVGIGGITVENLRPVIEAGADGVCVISGIMGDEDVEGRTRAYVEAVRSIRES